MEKIDYEQGKAFFNSLTDEQFVKWMNEEFLNPLDDRLGKIHEMTDDNYWTTYLKKLGMDIAWGVFNGCHRNSFNKTDRYVQYISEEVFFVTFNTKEDFFTDVWDMNSLIEEAYYRGFYLK
jgi:hypothetical protein